MFSMKLLINPQSGYIKIGAYLLILCHVISDVKFSHYFRLSKVKNVFLKLKSFRKQYQKRNRSSHWLNHVPCLNVGKLLRLNTHHFNLNRLCS